MKALKTLKVAVVSLLLFFMTQASAQNYILNGDNYIIDKRLQVKLNEIGTELNQKTNINLYVYIKNSYGMSKDLSMKEKFKIIKEKDSNLIKTLQKPYAVLILSLEDTYSNILISPELEDIIDKDEILDDYVIPILASKDKNQLYAKVSAAVLNGYSEMATSIISSRNDVKLDSDIESSGKTFGTIWKAFMYTLVIIGLLFYIYAVMKQRK